MPFAAVAVLLLLMATLAALIGHCNNDHKTLIACALYTLAGVAEKACLVDFAQVRYCPPASDILLFLRLLQIDDIDSYLIFYHSSLVKKVPSFSLEEFLDSCSEMDHFAFCVAPLYVYLTELPPAVIHQISRTPEDFMEFAMGKDEPALKAMDQDQIYRETVLRSFKELLDFADSQELKRGKGSSFLTRQEFAESCSFYKELGITAGLYYAYITQVPGKYLGPAVKDEEAFLDLMIGGKPTIPLEAIQDPEYKTNLVNAISDAIEFYTQA